MSGKGETHLSTEAMSAYVDGELGPVAHERAATHIRECFECAYAVGIQRQAKESLMRECGDFDVPSTLMSRLGQIPFSADLSGTLDEVGRYADEGGRFEFRVASPADPQKRRGGFSAFGNLRGRVFKGSAAAVAMVSVIVGPAAVGQTATEAQGHQMHVEDVVQRHIDQDSAGSTR